MRTLHNPALTEVTLSDPVFSQRQKICLDSTIPAVIKQTIDTGRIKAFDMTWKEGDEPLHVFWDSDVAKVMEGLAYALTLRKDSSLEKLFDEWTDKICRAQCPDGYLNTYFTQVAPDKRFTDLAIEHELYCAGHLMEAAVAAYVNLGKRKLLDAMCRYADYLCSVFGNGEGKRKGWPGHEEIELALAKLYKVTGKEEYKKLLSYFINDRGTTPNFFTEVEKVKSTSFLSRVQAHIPVREIKNPVGHAVRQMYLACGMADLAFLDHDPTLLEACETLFKNTVEKHMYITGGVGSMFSGEAFSTEYDLTNGSMMYSESCANMALALFGIRMFNLTGKSFYLDTVERCLYNSALSGISLSGDKFFYQNYLEMDENPAFPRNSERVPWFNCACCPTSFSRFIPQLGTFLYSVDAEKKEIALNIPAENTASLRMGEEIIGLSVRSDYPYDGKIRITFHTEGDYAFTFRIPAWCRKWKGTLNGEEEITQNTLSRHWKKGDTLLLDLEMKVEFVYSDPRVTNNASRCALTYGPVVYALEEVDHDCPVRELILRKDKGVRLITLSDGPLQNVPLIEGEAFREYWKESTGLYTTCEPIRTEVPFRAVPYALWQNRGKTNMAVWVRCCKE